MMNALSRIEYLTWAALRSLSPDSSCPSCGAKNSRLVRRKYIVTSLFACPECHLMFRVPKGDPSGTVDFYQSEYTEGFTTDCPAEDELERMKQTRFAATEKDFTQYIDVLRSAGLAPGAAILDFGCSWGYGSWQMKQAAFTVYSYEVSRPRARYAERMLSCTMVTPETLPHKVDCIFSSHVIEHLERPEILWGAAKRVLAPDGVAVIFLPNGDLRRAGIHSIWGRVHPLLINPVSLNLMAERHGFKGNVYTSPYPHDAIANSRSTDALTGDELLIVARRAP